MTTSKDPAEEPPVSADPDRGRQPSAEVDSSEAVAGAGNRSPSHPLFQRLRALRSRLADEYDVPAYLVFSDEVLWAMIDRRPTTSDELLQIPGVGPAKLARFGSVFLETLGAE